MKSRRLNVQITIQTKSTTYNTYGEPVDTWADTHTVWAGFISKGGSEFYGAQKLNASTTAVVSMWYISGITTENRIKYGSRYFEILNVNNADEANNELLLSVKEVV